MIPCSEVEKEAEPVSIPMSVIIDAPVSCLWERIDDWSRDHTWVLGAQVGNAAECAFLKLPGLRCLGSGPLLPALCMC